MKSSEPNPIDEVVSELRDAFADRLPVELWWPDGQEPTPGYVAAVEEDHVVLARLRQKAWLNGFLAARFTAIREVLPLEDDEEAFIAVAMEAQGEVLLPQFPVRAPTLEGLVAVVCAHFPMIVVVSGTGAEAKDVGGTVLRVEGHTARMRLLSRRGRWLDGEHELDLSQVTEVWFGSNYERVMERIGAFLGARGRPG